MAAMCEDLVNAESESCIGRHDISEDWFIK